MLDADEIPSVASIAKKAARATTVGLGYFALREYVLAQAHPSMLLMLFALSLFPWMIYYWASAGVGVLIRITEHYFPIVRDSV